MSESASDTVERVARILEPHAWAALGMCDTLAYKNRRTSSLRKARAVIRSLRHPSEAMWQAFGADLEYEPFCAYWGQAIDVALSGGDE